MHIYNCGVALVVIMSIFMCCCCVFSSFYFMAGRKEALIFAVGVLGICSRLVWIIIGPIIISKIAEVQVAVEDNLSIANEFEVVNNCADRYAHVDQGALEGIQLEERDKANTVHTLSWVVFYCMIAEVGLLLMTFCCSLLCRGGARDYNWCDEFKQYNFLYTKVGN